MNNLLTKKETAYIIENKYGNSKWFIRSLKYARSAIEIKKKLEKWNRLHYEQYSAESQ